MIKLLARNASVFTFLPFDRSVLESRLAEKPFVPCDPHDERSIGFVPPCLDGCTFAHSVGDVVAFAVREDTKLLPSSVVHDEATNRLHDIEEKEGRKVGRKEFRDIKTSTRDFLLTKAFTRSQVIRGWFDFTNNTLVIDTSSNAKCNKVLDLLRSVLDDLTPTFLPWGNISSATFFTNWIISEPPQGFTIDDRVTLSGIEGQTIKMIDNNAADEAAAMIGTRLVTELALTLNERVSFVLDDGLIIKRINLLNIKEEPATGQGELMEEARMDAEITLSALTVREVVRALVVAMDQPEAK